MPELKHINNASTRQRHAPPDRRDPREPNGAGEGGTADLETDAETGSSDGAGESDAGGDAGGGGDGGD